MKTNIKTRKLALTALFVALIAVGAFIKIPVPPVPFTLQSFFATMAGIFLGGFYGAIAMLVYIFMGLIGLPVFAGGGGFSYVLTPTFGFLIGMTVGALVGGLIMQKGNLSLKRIYIAEAVTTLIIYLFGVIYFYVIANLYLGKGLTVGYILVNCFLLFLPKDIVLCVIAGLVAKRVLPLVNKQARRA